jgi:hypothetical protein
VVLPLARQEHGRARTPRPAWHEVCGTSDLGLGWGYVRQLEIVEMTARVIGWCLGLNEGAKWMRRR